MSGYIYVEVIMRISCASFVRIKTSDGKLGVLVNKSRLRRGKTILTPIGGVMEVDASVGQEIMSLLGLTPENFEKSPTPKCFELRFVVDDSLVDVVRSSFLSWDSGPEREFREEMVDECGILTVTDLAGDSFSLEFLRASEELSQSDRNGSVPDQLTLRLVTVYELKASEAIQAKLETAATDPGSWLYFVTKAEIERGITSDGISIATICRSLLIL
jgi:hypothetical protein